MTLAMDGLTARPPPAPARPSRGMDYAVPARPTLHARLAGRTGKLVVHALSPGKRDQLHRARQLVLGGVSAARPASLIVGVDPPPGVPRALAGSVAGARACASARFPASDARFVCLCLLVRLRCAAAGMSVSMSPAAGGSDGRELVPWLLPVAHRRLRHLTYGHPGRQQEERTVVRVSFRCRGSTGKSRPQLQDR
jgi:hypothetical protein